MPPPTTRVGLARVRCFVGPCFLGARISRRLCADAALAVRARRRALGTHVPHVPVDLRVEASSIGLTCDTVGGGLTYGSAAGRPTRRSRVAGRLRHGSAVRGAQVEVRHGERTHRRSRR